MFTVAHWRMVSLIKLCKNGWPSQLTNIQFEASFHQLGTIKIGQNSAVTEMEESLLLWSLTLLQDHMANK